MSLVDVLVLTALPLEQEEFRRAANYSDTTGIGIREWVAGNKTERIPFMYGDYHIPGHDTLRMALACSTRMGGPTMGPMATMLALQLKPYCIAMSGVCAGNPGDLALGDVVIADRVFQWDEGKKPAHKPGKRKPAQIEGDWITEPQDEDWLQRLRSLNVTCLPSYGNRTDNAANRWIEECLYGGSEPLTHPAKDRYFPGKKWTNQLNRMIHEKIITLNGDKITLTKAGRTKIAERLILEPDLARKLPYGIAVGPIASGNVVVKDGVTWDVLKHGARTTLGLEMEAATIGTVRRILNIPRWLVAKGVMDHADIRKNDRFKKFAARASAEVLLAAFHKLVSDELLAPTVPRTTTYQKVTSGPDARRGPEPTTEPEFRVRPEGLSRIT